MIFSSPGMVKPSLTLRAEAIQGDRWVVAGPRRWLRLEGLGLLVICTVLFAQSQASWWLFAGLFLLPDLSFAAYLLNRRAGTIAYNLTHTEVGPILLGLFALTGFPDALPIALIWGAHIGWDRMLGYGLKYDSDFDHTHLGLIGKAAKAARQTG